MKPIFGPRSQLANSKGQFQPTNLRLEASRSKWLGETDIKGGFSHLLGRNGVAGLIGHVPAHCMEVHKSRYQPGLHKSEEQESLSTKS